ncbi:hypothetical protein SAMN02927916_3150 [Flavobacterium anhuiense]|uniref:Uncharacterized protein n=1 Tax=Flavobacterium anhuiense TaxID=459526 RepID=A0ABY0LWS6_9FLAO|nr:hypothetical protein [Flavobacterium anhuiense]SCY74507.1 hypothetical protein SAMN02927916_3150 [Flavobacterium anhuiense]
MKTIEYFKLQAKNLHKDFKTQKPYFDSSLGDNLFEYAPKFFDVDALVTDFDIDEKQFTLMNAQHIIARLAGFEKWTVLLKGNPDTLELSKLLFDNMDKISIEEWDIYISGEQHEKGFLFDEEFKLDIFKAVFADVDGHQSGGYDYRLAKREKPSIENQKIKPMEKKSTIKITTLPLTGIDRKEFIETANRKFEDVLQTIEPTHPELIRQLWNPEQYIDEVLKSDMLPIDRDYALSLIEAFLVNNVIDLAAETDQEDFSLN